MNLENKIKKINWQKVLARKTDVQKSEQFIRAIGIRFAKHFKTEPILNQLYYFDGNTTHMFYDREEFIRFENSLRKRLGNVKFIEKELRTFFLVFENILKHAKKLNKDKTTTIKELFYEWDELWTKFYTYGWFFFYTPFLDDLVERGIKKYFKKDADEIIRVLSRPSRLTPLQAQEVDIMRLALGELNPEILCKRYGWMSVYNFEDNPRTKEFYINEAKQINTAVAENKIRDTRKSLRENEKRFKEIYRQIKNRLLKAQVKLFHDSGFLRDKREEVRDRLTILEKDLYNKIGKMCGLDLGGVVYLTNEEIGKALTGKINFKDIAQKRRKRFLMQAYGEKVTMIDNIDSFVKEIIKEEKVEKFLGKIAFASQPVKGPVRLVLNNQDVQKVNRGDILVASMTKPDYLQAIKKASAIITDEGGITCHAAIISRELKKPCIIGTKIATKVLKDGDLVEVDAEKGIIKVI